MATPAPPASTNAAGWGGQPESQPTGLPDHRTRPIHQRLQLAHRPPAHSWTMRSGGHSDRQTITSNRRGPCTTDHPLGHPVQQTTPSNRRLLSDGRSRPSDDPVLQTNSSDRRPCPTDDPVQQMAMSNRRVCPTDNHVQQTSLSNSRVCPTAESVQQTTTVRWWTQFDRRSRPTRLGQAHRQTGRSEKRCVYYTDQTRSTYAV